MSFEVLQTRKVLSNVQQVFQPNYNRVTWEISPIGGLATDLTKSYIAFRMYLTYAETNVRLTAADYAELLAKNLMIEFGQNGFSYPAASLIQVARLYSRKDQSSPLEELLFQNLWACTMHQLCQDLETIAADSLSSGAAVALGTNGSLASQITCLMLSQIGADTQQLPVEIHIPLSDIFGLCKNTHFDMSLTDGLIIQFELEPIKSLFQTRAVGNRVSIPPSASLDPSGVGFPYQPEVSPYTFLPHGQGDFDMPSYQFATQTYDASGNALVQPPSGYHYSDVVYKFFNPTNPTTVTTQTITLKGIWTLDQLTASKFVTDAVIQLNFKWTDPAAGMRTKMITCLDTISGVTPSATVNATTITLSNLYLAPAGISVATNTNVTLESFDVFVSVVADASGAGVDIQAIRFSTVGSSDAAIAAGSTPPSLFFEGNKLVVPEITLGYLQSMGVVVVNEDGSRAGNGSFRLMAQPFDLSGGNPLVIPYLDEFVNPDIPTARQIWAAQAKPLAVQGTECQILSVSAIDASGNSIITFKDFGFANNNSLQNGVVQKTSVGLTGTRVSNTSDNIGFTLFLMKSRNALIEPGWSKIKGYSFQIDKAEIVLVEMTLDPSIPQTLVYETLRVEVATIETSNLDVYNRQFVVNEPAVFNAWLLTPQYAASERLGIRNDPADVSGNSFYYEHPECLVSYARGVTQYKWAYNNIQDSNRYIEVQTNTSKYPSSLHIEKLMDAYGNTTKKMKNFSGIMTVPRTASDPVVCFPLRIYEAIDEGQVFLREGGFQLQIELLGDSTHNSPIIAGSIYLFKQMLKTIR